MINLIAAMSRNRVIGRDNTLPWHLPEDLKHFKQTTKGCPMIMGRKTWESLPGLLPGRQHIIVTRNPDLYIPEGANAITVSSIEAGIEAAKLSSQEVFIIGGANIYEQAMPLADRLIISEIDIDIVGDAYFPEINDTEWKRKHVEFKYSSTLSFKVCTYAKVQAAT